jgi:hypothetical protein
MITVSGKLLISTWIERPDLSSWDMANVSPFEMSDAKCLLTFNLLLGGFQHSVDCF